MNKTIGAIGAALVVSLGVNAWQFSQQTGDDQPAKHDQGLLATKGAARHQGDSDGGGVGPNANQPDGIGKTPVARQAPGTLAGILAMGDPLARIDALLAFVKNVPTDQIGKILGDLRAGADQWDPESRLLAHLLLTRWAQEDPDAAFASLEGRGGKEGSGDAISILSSLAATDPARAVAWLGDPGNRMANQPYLAHMLARTIGEQWALRDRDAALQWAAGLPDRQRAGAYSGIIGNLASTDPQRAATLAMELDPGDRGKLMGEIAERWALQSPDQAVAWASALEESDRASALPDALGAWALTAPAAAAAFVDQLPETQRVDHVSQVARTWSDQAPADAAAWLGTQPESGGKAQAMGHVMWDWTNADPEAAAAWLGEQDGGPSYDSGVAGLSKAATHVYQDGESGVTWAATIENENLRGRMMTHSLGQWIRQDPEAARAWATQNGVDPPAASRGGGK